VRATKAPQQADTMPQANVHGVWGGWEPKEFCEGRTDGGTPSLVTTRTPHAEGVTKGGRPIDSDGTAVSDVSSRRGDTGGQAPNTNTYTTWPGSEGTPYLSRQHVPVTQLTTADGLEARG
jgi:hypothetical protein